jgi:hypothetical protein
MSRTTRDDDFALTVSAWLHGDAEHRMPDTLDAVLRRTRTERQRPAWSSLERWLPVDLAVPRRRFLPATRIVWALVVLALIAVMVAGVVLVGAGQHRLPHFGAQANGSIAFVDGGNLKVAGPDGLNVRLAAPLPNGVESLRYSPDGTHLAYRTTTSPAALVVAEADGTRPVVVSDGLAVAHAGQTGPAGGGFAWSPDGRRLAFAWTASASQRSIDVVDADGSHLSSLMADAAGPAVDRFDPAWSPDGQWIAYFATEAPGTAAINVVHPDGTGARRLPTSPVDLGYLELTWAPDPAQLRLEYVSGVYETGNDVEIFDLATAKETRVGSGFFGTWSPDARSIAWWDDRPGSVGAPDAGGTRVASVAEVLAGRHPDIRVFPDQNNASCYYVTPRTDAICGSAAWSPDSAWIYGPDPSGTSIVFSTVDAPRTVRSIKLDHPVDLSNGPQGSLAWQPVAP